MVLIYYFLDQTSNFACILCRRDTLLTELFKWIKVYRSFEESC